jgi:sterol desaturase/sphingolipid hydroxylase (fatty acid hydroxylase superfamily)
MEKYIEIFVNSFFGYYNYLKDEILFTYQYKPWYENYFYALIFISLFFLLLEIIIPWRKKQPILRKDFWLDTFYMFFNFFILSLIGFAAISNIFVELFNDFLSLFGIKNVLAIEVAALPNWAKLTFAFILKDFIHWNVHRLLHKHPRLWEFHKVHHSVKQMGFAAHLRFHWMERVVYNSIQYIPLAMLGFGIEEYFAAHIIALTIGHFNHANVDINIGWLGYIFNNPRMHIWHHAKHLPKEHPTGVNFGLSLSIWDYLFKTAYIPSDGRDIELGFENDEKFPKKFLAQEFHGLKK